MKKVKTWSITAVVALVLAALLVALGGCGGDPVAATVNGEKIYEKYITTKIMSMRNGNESFKDDTMWATALSYSSMTPESLREEVIKSEVQSIVINQMAKEQSLTADKEAVDKQVEQAKTTIGGDEKTWTETLVKYGYLDEADFRHILETSNLQTQLSETIAVEPTQEELEQFVSQYASYVTGKRSSAIQLTVTPELTQEEMDRIASEVKQKATEGTDFSTLVTEYSTVEGATENDGDQGWAATSSTIDPGYKTALDALAVGDISAPVTNADGTIVYIIKCTDEFTLPETEASTDASGGTATAAATVPIADVPTEIVDFLKEQWVSMNRSTKFQELLTQRADEADLVINDMPEGLPYDVDMSLAPSTEASTTSDYSASEAEAVQAAIDGGLLIEDTLEGTGTTAEPGSTLKVLYTGKLADGTVFDSNVASGEAFSVVLGTGSVIKGWDAGLVGMKAGGKRNLVIPAEFAYGEQGQGSIPPNATLYFEIELVEVTPPASSTEASAGGQ